MRTLNFNLRDGMDSMLRVVSLLRRKGFNVSEIRLSNNILTFDISEDMSVMVVNNVNKLADVSLIA